MNFVAHYIQVLEKSPYEKLGVIFPDLYPNFSKTFNIHFRQIDHMIETEIDLNNKEILLGIRKHYRDDGIFHNLYDFKRFIHEVSIQMNEIEALKPFKRKNFFTHILFEVVLDHLIIKQSTKILDKLYEDMEQIDYSKIQLFCQKYIPNINFNSLFLKNFTSFKQARFLELYYREEQLIRVLKRTTSSICEWDTESNEVNEAIMEIILQNLENVSYKKILTELK
jgi:hypothetical protein